MLKSIHTNISQSLIAAALAVVCLLLSACGSGTERAATPTFTPQEARGQAIVSAYCANCHSTGNDSVIVGPSLLGIASRAEDRVPGMDARAYITESILKPDAYIVDGFPDNQMPENYGEVLGEEELNAVVAYLLNLTEK